MPPPRPLPGNGMLSFALDCVLVLATASAPQGATGVPPALAPRMDYPLDPAMTAFAPFVDAQGTALPNSIVAAGALDFDLDGTNELWFVSDAGPHAGEVSVMMNRDFDVGRFRHYDGNYPNLPTPIWSDATGAWILGPSRSVPRVLLCDKNSPFLWELELIQVLGALDPRDSAAVTFDATALQGLHVSEFGVYEVEAADHAGDGYSDLYRLVETPLAQYGVVGTTIRKEIVTRDQAGMIQYSQTQLVVPARCDRLRVGDYDGDGSTDFTVRVLGLGVVSFTESNGTFTHIGGLRLPAGVLRDLVTGDADGDGRDDLACVFDDGVLLYRWNDVDRFRAMPDVLVRPAEIAPLTSAAIVNSHYGDSREVVALPHDAIGYAAYSFDPSVDGFGGAWVELPEDPAPYAGAGPLGRAAFTGDFDGDGDRDLVVQTGRGDWLGMASPEIDLAPQFVTVLGPPLPDQWGHYLDTVTLWMPPSPTGQPMDVEIVVYEYHNGHADYLREETQLHQPDPNGVLQFDIKITPGLYLPPNPTRIWVANRAVVSIHYRDVTTHQRFASTLLEYGGPTGGDGSAVGLRWRLIATPPLPDLDDELLPWN